MLQVEHIYKTFFPGTINEKKALVDTTLHLKPGDFTTVIGSNGAGKSTMLNAIAGVWPIDKGVSSLTAWILRKNRSTNGPGTSAGYSRIPCWERRPV